MTMTPARPLEETTTPREQYVHGLLAQHREALTAMLDTEETYRQIQAAYRDRNPGNLPLADVLATKDPRVQRAVTDGRWHRDRAAVFALSYLAEREAGKQRARRCPS